MYFDETDFLHIVLGFVGHHWRCGDAQGLADRRLGRAGRRQHACHQRGDAHLEDKRDNSGDADRHCRNCRTLERQTIFAYRREPVLRPAHLAKRRRRLDQTHSPSRRSVGLFTNGIVGDVYAFKSGGRQRVQREDADHRRTGGDTDRDRKRSCDRDGIGDRDVRHERCAHGELCELDRDANGDKQDSTIGKPRLDHDPQRLNRQQHVDRDDRVSRHSFQQLQQHGAQVYDPPE